MKKSRFYRSANLFRVMALAMALESSAVLAEQPAAAKNYQFHGFASQGYINSDGNNFYGDSRGGGSTDYYEAGLNGIWQLNDKFSMSGQVYARKAGETDDGEARIDYAFVDYRALVREDFSGGVRLGRVKNPLGFYNESRDAVFTRPSILLPQSVYLEGTGIRELLFSSDGVQLYGDWEHGAYHTSFKLNIAKTSSLPKETEDNFVAAFGGLPPGVTVDTLTLESPIYAQILQESSDGKMRYGVSYLDASITGTFNPSVFPPVALDAQYYVLSGQYNQERWTLTSEYSFVSSTTKAAGTKDTNKSEGVYLQHQYRITPEWTSLLRYDVEFGDRNDRSGTDARDATAGLSWSPTPSWNVKGEYHYIHGSSAGSSIPAIDNPGGTGNRTRLLVLMVGWRF